MAIFTNSNDRRADNASATCDLCTNCDGRGFHWRIGKIVSHSGAVIADTLTQGDMCVKCYGSGKLKAPAMELGRIVLIAGLLTPFVLGAYWVLLNL
jgi:hypothetical protein